MGECDACNGCYDDLHGDMDMSEMPMESEYVDGPCDGACSACDMCCQFPQTTRTNTVEKMGVLVYNHEKLHLVEGTVETL